MEATGVLQSLGGEAMYCVVVACLSIVSWIIFSYVDDDAQQRPRKRRPCSACCGGGSGDPVSSGALYA
ncbi:hypothetical protein ZIOFF_025144 [Zingiber officinale]|uniref:Uncharacterized protein n=1 Tax=Zingiber officinale TaxID=94328 RepID=A0A8J5LE45_ZINOF|nr:hypothetical protein ZIOFF_025144 [Zingiber officinale]